MSRMSKEVIQCSLIQKLSFMRIILPFQKKNLQKSGRHQTESIYLYALLRLYNVHNEDLVQYESPRRTSRNIYNFRLLYSKFYIKDI